MPPTTSFEPGDVVLVPFPFSDQSGSKRRPALVVSSALYHSEHSSIIVLAISSQVRPTAESEVELRQWKRAGLLAPSVVKAAIAAIERDLVLRRLGRIADPDRQAVRALLDKILLAAP